MARIGGLKATYSTSELGVLDAVTAGTIAASKAIVVDSNKDAADARNWSATNLKAGKDAAAGTVTVFPTTTAKGKAVWDCTDQTGNTQVTHRTAAMGQATVVTTPDPGASAASVVLTVGSQVITGTKQVNDLDVGASGTGGAFDIFPTTALKGKITILAADNAGDTITTITNASQAAARTYTVPDAGASTSFAMLAGNQTWLGQQTFAVGTTAIAPYKLQAGTNLTTAAVGASEFDGVCFYQTAVASARQVSDCEQFICLTGDFTLTDNATAQKAFNSPASGSVAVAAATSYFFEFEYCLTNTGATSHTWAVLFAFTTATLTSGRMTVKGRTGITGAGTFTAELSGYTTDITTALVCTAASTANPEHVIISGKGIMRINAGGTVVPQIKASAQPNGTEKMLANSWFRMWPVGSNTVASVGNWT